MSRLGLLGAALLIGLGLDCTRSPRSDDARDESREESSTTTISAAPTKSDDDEPFGPAAPPSSTEPLAPGTRYALLAPETCIAELAARGIAHEALPPRLGITTPVRLRGKLGGVSFRTLWPEAERARTSYEIIDCRLVLALNDFAPVLRTHGIVDVMFFSAYRPPPAGWTESQASSVHRHEAGLAIDIGYFRKADGSALNVERDFMPRAGERERICAKRPPPKTATMDALELRKIACEARDARLFHVTLTPAYDAIHRDHFHLELAPDKTDFLAR